MALKVKGLLIVSIVAFSTNSVANGLIPIQAYKNNKYYSTLNFVSGVKLVQAGNKLYNRGKKSKDPETQMAGVHLIGMGLIAEKNSQQLEELSQQSKKIAEKSMGAPIKRAPLPTKIRLYQELRKDQRVYKKLTSDGFKIDKKQAEIVLPNGKALSTSDFSLTGMRQNRLPKKTRALVRHHVMKVRSQVAKIPRWPSVINEPSPSMTLKKAAFQVPEEDQFEHFSKKPRVPKENVIAAVLPKAVAAKYERPAAWPDSFKVHPPQERSLFDRVKTRYGALDEKGFFLEK